MQGIFDLVSWFYDGILRMFEVVGMFLKYFVYAFLQLMSVLFNISKYFDWLPIEVVSTILVGIGVVVVYKILGREG